MSRIDIAEVNDFLSRLKNANETARKQLSQLTKVIHDYESDGDLQGKAIDASKNYYVGAYLPLIQSIYEAMDMSEEKIQQYLIDFANQVDSSYNCKIDAEGLYEVDQKIKKLKREYERIQEELSIGTAMARQGELHTIQLRMFDAYEKENLLEKYIQFEQGHGNFFDGIGELVYHIQRSVDEIQNNVAFNVQTGTYNFDKVHVNVFKDLQKTMRNMAAKEVQKELAAIADMDKEGNITGVKWTELANLLRRPDQLTKEQIEAIKMLWAARGSIANQREQDLFNLFSPIISPLLGFEYNGSGDYYYTNEHSIQSYGGFMDFYDEAGVLLGMDLATDVITFISGGKEYRVQLWKGSYGFGNAYGGELGIYYRDAEDAKTNPYHEGKDDSKFIWYECADEPYQWKSVSKIFDKDTNTMLLRNDTRARAENGDHFWNLAIKTDPTSGYNKNNIYMVEEVEIPDLTVRDDFVAALEKESSVTNISIEGNVVTFSWGN
ncbi:T7SS effector LXG polymorphic toxin [Listeria costaricensis]|uniref:T7SS effector LXG polymorphic toxin n=1 Tax=Listeria costaricensis TaxID=2026604 RepID=UPI000C06D8FC|nr:T7SS effector LXG polymorphic toxin [Listeria costaricensis]